MDYSATQWEDIPHGKIDYEKIINAQTNKTIKYDDLTIIVQIECNKHCRDYLRNNNLDSYSNIIPFVHRHEF